MIKKNVSNPVVAAYLKDKGILLSTMSVSRHKNNHVLNKKKPRQLQKKAILNIKNKVRKNNIRIKNNPQTALKQDQKKIVKQQRVLPKTRDAKKKQAGYLKELEIMEKDLDVVREFTELLAMSKSRLKRAHQEEEDSELVLATTGAAGKDYARMLKDYHEITAGMSNTELRYAQMIQLIGNIFANEALSDRTRFELLSVMKDNAIVIDAENIEPIRPATVIEAKPKKKSSSGK